MALRRGLIDSGVALDHRQRVIGMRLGYDHIVEHELGLRGINEAFGIAGKPQRRMLWFPLVGPKVYAVSRTPQQLRYVVTADFAFLFFNVADALLFHNVVHPKLDETFVSAWDRDRFAIRVKRGILLEQDLEDVHRALLDKDALIVPIKGAPISSRANPTIFIASRLPVREAWEMRQEHLDELEGRAA